MPVNTTLYVYAATVNSSVKQRPSQQVLTSPNYLCMLSLSRIL